MIYTGSTPLLLNEQLSYSTDKASMPCQSWSVAVGSYCVLLGFRPALLQSQVSPYILLVYIIMLLV